MYAENNQADQADGICKALDGEVPVPKSDQENTDYYFAFSKVKPDAKTIVLGMTDKGTENIWTDYKGEKLGFTKWDTLEPNNSNNQDYAVFWMPGASWRTKIAHAWDDVRGQRQLSIICECYNSVLYVKGKTA